MTTATLPATIEQLNRDCFCFSLDREALANALDADLGQPCLSATAAPADVGWPTVAERERMHALLFEATESAA